jgi:hypothetical protein
VPDYKLRQSAIGNLAGTLAFLLLASLSAVAAPEPVDVLVPRPEPLLGMELGGGLSSYIISSHLQTGWARYLETVPATRLIGGIGSWTAAQNLRMPEDVERILSTLHEYGIRLFRYEIGWGSTAYRDDLAQPMALQPHVEAVYRAALRASKARGFRLLMLLNAHQGAPCALASNGATFLEDAAQGATEAVLRIDQPARLKVGYSGISGLTNYQAAEGLFKAIEPVENGTNVPDYKPENGTNVPDYKPEKAFRVQLSKPLPKDYPKGTSVTVDTLQYRPFGDPESDPETYQGWADYARLLARIASEEGLRNGDVHFEIWNEGADGLPGVAGAGRRRRGTRGRAGHYPVNGEGEHYEHRC